MKSRLRLILVTLLVMLGAAGPLAAQSTLPIAFSDPAPSAFLWPDPVEATILNNTTASLIVALQFTAFTNAETGANVPAVELLQRYAPSITLAPAGQASLSLPVREEAGIRPGSYTASLVLALESHNVVLRKAVTIVVPNPSGAVPTVSAPLIPVVSETPTLTPAVSMWTLNAIRVLPSWILSASGGSSPGAVCPWMSRWAARRWRALSRWAT